MHFLGVDGVKFLSGRANVRNTRHGRHDVASSRSVQRGIAQSIRNRGRGNRSIGTGRTRGPGVALRALSTSSASNTLDALRASSSGITPRASSASGSGVALSALCASSSGIALQTLDALRALSAGGASIALRALDALLALCTSCTRVALIALQTLDALVALQLSNNTSRQSRDVRQINVSLVGHSSRQSSNCRLITGQLISNFFQRIQSSRSGANHGSNRVVNLVSDAGVGQNCGTIHIHARRINRHTSANRNRGCLNSRNINRIRSNNHHRTANRLSEVQAERVVVNGLLADADNVAISIKNLNPYVGRTQVMIDSPSQRVCALDMNVRVSLVTKRIPSL